MMNQSTNSTVPAYRQRRAAVLICVMLVMMVAGMLTLQGTRLLIAASRAAQQQAKMEQVQELLALGRMRLASQLKARGDDYRGEVFAAPLYAQATSKTIEAEIRIERVDRATQTASVAGWRIVAVYPLNQPGQNTASWETDL